MGSYSVFEKRWVAVHQGTAAIVCCKCRRHRRLWLRDGDLYCEDCASVWPAPRGTTGRPESPGGRAES